MTRALNGKRSREPYSSPQWTLSEEYCKRELIPSTNLYNSCRLFFHSPHTPEISVSHLFLIVYRLHAFFLPYSTIWLVLPLPTMVCLDFPYPSWIIKIKSNLTESNLKNILNYWQWKDSVLWKLMSSHLKFGRFLRLLIPDSYFCGSGVVCSSC